MTYCPEASTFTVKTLRDDTPGCVLLDSARAPGPVEAIVGDAVDIAATVKTPSSPPRNLSKESEDRWGGTTETTDKGKMMSAGEIPGVTVR